MSRHETTRRAYAARADEYAALLGSITAMSPLDRDQIAEWVREVHGPILDAGCGPGHWTAYMQSLGADARGIDLVPEFVTHARRAFPSVEYRVGSVQELDSEDRVFGGILAWYSLIHMTAEDVQRALHEFARVLRPGGALLLGFFEGSQHVEFDHAIAPAYFWSVAGFRAVLEAAGVEVEATDSRTDPGTRPHASIAARRR